MFLSVIYDSQKMMGMVLRMEGIPPKAYSVKLMDHKRGIYRQQFTFREYDDAKKTFDELQRVYDLH